jgi:hypothetical protein
MNHLSTFTLIGATLAFTALAAAQQTAPPAPPAAMRPLAPPDRDSVFQFDSDRARELAQQAREQARQVSEEAREQARQMAERAREQAEEARRNIGNFNFDLNLNLEPFRGQQGVSGGVKVGVQPRGLGQIRNDGTLYGRGLTALDEHHYDQALEDFTEVVTRGGPKADGALYWKAYTLNKLGRRDEAIAAIAQLRTAYAGSHWLEDAKALELEVKQASGKPVSPEAEADDDLKLMALNGLSQSDPERTYPLIEKILKGPASPKLKKNAIYVLAANGSSRAQQLLEQIARGNSNPDLQLTAIRYMVENKQQPNRSQVLMEIYSSSSDVAVKREILNAFRNSHDYDRLMQIARSEKGSGDLRQTALSGLGDKSGNAELWQLYQSETSPEAKIQILDAMYANGSAEKLAEVARTEKDPKVRIAAIRVLSSYKAANNSATLTSLYAAEQDPQVKRAIVTQLSTQRAAKALVDIYHKETDAKLKLDIVTRLRDMHTPEANELFLEILK